MSEFLKLTEVGPCPTSAYATALIIKASCTFIYCIHAKWIISFKLTEVNQNKSYFDSAQFTLKFSLIYIQKLILI